MIIFVPNERLPGHFSDDWFAWFDGALAESGRPYMIVGDTRSMPEQPVDISTDTKTDQYDIYNTNIYRLNQMQEIIRFIRMQKPTTELSVFFMDLWFPSLECLALIRDCGKRNIKISGLLHGGTYDPHDPLTKKNCRRWGYWLESAWFKMADKIFVATEFHQNMLCDVCMPLCREKIEIVHFPVRTFPELRETATKENIVVFPHQLVAEKQPPLFDVIQLLYNQTYGPNDHIQWLKATAVCADKGAYYRLLLRSKVAVSFALQETFGIAMQEAINCGCWPVVPNRLAYLDIVDLVWRYDTLDQCVQLIHKGLEQAGLPETRYSEDVRDIVRRIP